MYELQIPSEGRDELIGYIPNGTIPLWSLAHDFNYSWLKSQVTFSSKDLGQAYFESLTDTTKDSENWATLEKVVIIPFLQRYALKEVDQTLRWEILEEELTLVTQNMTEVIKKQVSERSAIIPEDHEITTTLNKILITVDNLEKQSYNARPRGSPTIKRTIDTCPGAVLSIQELSVPPHSSSISLRPQI